MQKVHRHKNEVVWGTFTVGQSRSLEMHRSTEYNEFLLAFHSKYIHILHRFCDIARYRSKIADFNRPHLYLALPLR